jgi:dihydroorotate dehydrogenase electron transfer subunit
MVFPSRIDSNGINVEFPLLFPALPGSIIDLLGPLGRGFTPPKGSKNWLLISFGEITDRFFPLLKFGLAAGVEISWWVEKTPRNLPEQVEISLDAREAAVWADYLAIDLTFGEMLQFKELLGSKNFDHVQSRAEVLIARAMPCGVGVCAACAVKGTKGWKLSCTQGPVFPLADLGQ